MNSPHIVATAALLMLLLEFNTAEAAGPYDIRSINCKNSSLGK
jgi:hypothetical protein